MPHLWADTGTFERQLDLRNRGLYLTRLWIVLIHCLLVVVSMYAVCLLSVRAKPGWAGLGFLAFFVFALTEIFRTSLALFALNRSWRTRYAANPDPETRGSIRAMIEAFVGINDALFFIFIVAFFLGLLCYGVALAADKTSDRAMGFLFLTWAVLTLPAIIDAVRAAKIAKDRGIGGPILSAASYFMKSPPEQRPDDVARASVEAFIRGEIER